MWVAPWGRCEDLRCTCIVSFLDTLTAARQPKKLSQLFEHQSDEETKGHYPHYGNVIVSPISTIRYHYERHDFDLVFVGRKTAQMNPKVQDGVLLVLVNIASYTNLLHAFARPLIHLTSVWLLELSHFNFAQQWPKQDGWAFSTGIKQCIFCICISPGPLKARGKCLNSWGFGGFWVRSFISFFLSFVFEEQAGLLRLILCKLNEGPNKELISHQREPMASVLNAGPD